MNIATVAFCKLEADYKFFEVGTESDWNKKYDYIIPDDLLVGVGDYCLVVIRNSNRCEVVRIINIQDENMYSSTTKDKLMPLVCKVNFEYINKYVDKVKRKEFLEKQINNMYNKVSKLKILEQMAKEDESLAKLVDEYKSLG